jgi:hypothetical protein
MVFWYILWYFGIFYGLYFPLFGMLHQEKYGYPALKNTATTSFQDKIAQN